VILNKRQTAILYKIIEAKDFLSYKKLCSSFFASEKTIRNDIKIINSLISKDGIEIKLTKGKGFYIEGNLEEKDKLRNTFSYRFKDTSDVLVSYKNHDLSIYALLVNGYIKIRKIAEKTHINEKTISLRLKEIRSQLEDHDLKLISKPGLGICIVGDEIKIRQLYIDVVSYALSDGKDSIFSENIEDFNLHSNEIQTLFHTISKKIALNNINLSENGLIRFVSSILITYIRSSKGFTISLDNKQIELIKKFKNYPFYKQLLSNLNFSLSKEDYDFLIASSIVVSDIKDLSIYQKLYQKQITTINNELFKELKRFNICEYDDRLAKCFDCIILNSLLMKEFGLFQNAVSSTVKNIISRTPLCINIAFLMDLKLESLINYRLGLYTTSLLCMSLYDCIRYVTRTKHLSNVAIYSPRYEELGDSLKERILYHFSNLINNIDILTYSTAINSNLDKYDLILYFGDYEPFILRNSKNKLKVDYFFDKNDKNTLYENLSVMSRFYKDYFNYLDQTNIIVEDNIFSNMHDVIVYGRKLFKGDKNLLEQLDLLPMSDLLFFNNTLCFVLFTDKNELCTTKLLKFKQPIVYHDQKVKVAMINVINSHKSLADLKTIGSVIRKMLSNIDDDTLAIYSKKANVIDFLIKE